MHKLLSMILLVGVTWAAEPISLVLKVDNMTCSGCVFTVKRALQKVDGVKKVKVSLKPPEAWVTFDPEKATVTDLVEATARFGYPAWVYFPIRIDDLSDSLRTQKGIKVIEDDAMQGILVDPHRINALKLLTLLPGPAEGSK